MSEKVFFHSSKGNELCGALYPSSSKDIAISCHGFRSSKYSTTNQGLQKIFAGAGIATFCFDFFAHGESAGEIEDITISEAVDGILQAIKLVKERGYKRISLIGSSFGGISSIIAASKSNDLVALALKCPVCNYLEKEMHTSGKDVLGQWQVQGYRQVVLNGEEFRLNYSFVHDFQYNNGYEVAPQIAIPTFIVHGDCDDVVPIAQSKRIVELFPDCRLQVIEGGNHHFDREGELDKVVQLLADFVIGEFLNTNKTNL